jgi:HK97 gp10 family phage protein
MKTTVKLEGLREVKAALQRLRATTETSIIKQVLSARAEPIAETARRLAPVEHGDLRDGIVVSDRLTARQRGLHQKRGPNEVEVFVGAGPHPQAHLQEFGTSHHPAQPFMRPAWDQHKEKALEGIVADFWAAIKKALARGGRGKK